MNENPHHLAARTFVSTFALAGLAAGLLSPTPVQAHKVGYPTKDRVLYVEACMAEHPGPRFEMLSKCSCVMDKIAEKVPFGQFETMQTATYAFSIGGERGNVIRDTEVLTDEIKRYKELQATAKKGCFIQVEGK